MPGNASSDQSFRFRNLGRAALASALVVFAGGARAEHINVGLVKSTVGSPLYIAKEKGYFAAERLDADLIYFEGGAASVAVAVVSGDVDFGVVGLSAALLNFGAQGAVKIIGGGPSEAPSFRLDAIFASNRAYAAGLRSIKDLADHSVGVTAVGSPGHYSVALLGEKYGFALSSVRILPLQSFANIASALQGGTADAGVEISTVARQLIDGDKGKLLAWIGDETPYQLVTPFTTTKTADGRHDTVEKFMRAYRQGARDFHDAFTGSDGRRANGKAAPELLALIASYIGQTPEQAEQGISYVDPEGRLDVADIRHQIEWFRSSGLVKANIDADALIDTRYIVPLPPHP